MRRLRSTIFVAIMATLMAYAAISLQLRRQLLEGYSDFISFYTAGKILQRRTPEKLYDLGVQYEIQKQHAPHVTIRAAALPYVRPAFEAWLFVPFAYLSYRAAFVLWDTLSVIGLVLTAALLRWHISELQQFSPAVIFLFLVSFFPVFITLLQGQDSILLALVYLFAYRALWRGNDLSAGMILGLGTFKFPLVVPFLVPFIRRGRVRTIGGFLITSFVLVVLSVATVGLHASVE